MTLPAVSLSDLAYEEKVALWSLRCLALPEHCGMKKIDGFFPSSCRSTLKKAGEALQSALAYMHYAQLDPLCLGIPARQEISDKEQRLLSVLEIAQSGRIETVRLLLAWDFADPCLRALFLIPITHVADCMAGLGYWLPPREGRTHRVQTAPARRQAIHPPPCLARRGAWKGHKVAAAIAVAS